MRTNYEVICGMEPNIGLEELKLVDKKLKWTNYTIFGIE
jgi:hypothetical protein